MNRYVVMVPEEYDQYAVDVPHPIETDLTREELLGELRDFHQEMRALTWDVARHRVLDLGGTGLMVEPLMLVSGHFYTEFVPLEILTVDEWFDSEVRGRR